MTALRRSLLREQQLSRTDYLTGAANKRYFTEQLDREIYRSGRTGQVMSLAYIDLDNFKTMNDTLGHSTGDLILKTAVRVFLGAVRKHDAVGRIGGDEFVILLPETGLEGAVSVLGRIRDVFLSEMAMNQFPVSLSIGIAVFIKPPASSDSAFSCADSQMYKAKKGGKDKIVTAEFKSIGNASEKN